MLDTGAFPAQMIHVAIREPDPTNGFFVPDAVHDFAHHALVPDRP
jgi:hypothetical protein|tara:strand:- start:967 stop:1101 length:135 start_codon:yes stop_codon:yes gene_type:complete